MFDAQRPTPTPSISTLVSTRPAYALAQNAKSPVRVFTSRNDLPPST